MTPLHAMHQEQESNLLTFINQQNIDQDDGEEKKEIAEKGKKKKQKLYLETLCYCHYHLKGEQARHGEMMNHQGVEKAGEVDIDTKKETHLFAKDSSRLSERTRKSRLGSD